MNMRLADHRCAECEDWGMFGMNGVWYCRAHVPEEFWRHVREAEAEQKTEPAESPDPISLPPNAVRRQGRLL